mgnify:CR=1 FL=1
MEPRNICVDRPLKTVTPYNVFKKHVLSEEFVSVHTVSKNLLIDNKKITNHIKKAKKKEERIRPEVWYSDNNYFKLDIHQHITWMNGIMSTLLIDQLYIVQTQAKTFAILSLNMNTEDIKKEDGLFF